MKKTKRNNNLATLNYYRKFGYIGEIVQRWNSFSHTRHDFCNFADGLVFKNEEMGVLAFNACSDSKVQEHFNAYATNPHIKEWLQAKNRLMIVAWGKRNKDGKRGGRKVWIPREIQFTLEHIKI